MLLTRSVQRQIQEAEVFANAQKIRNMGRKRHKRMLQIPNDSGLGREDLEILAKRNRLDGREWNYPVETTVTLDDLKYGIGCSRAQYKRTIKSRISVPEYYTEEDLIKKFGKTFTEKTDTDVLNEILEMKSRGL